MHYYEVTASKSNSMILHQEYAAFRDSRDADTLREELCRTHDVVGVVRITKKQYEAAVSQI